MASWYSLPYELKLKIAKDLIDSILADAERPSISFCVATPAGLKRPIDEYVSQAKEYVRSVLKISPELQKDLHDYCHKQYLQESPIMINRQLSIDVRISSARKGHVAMRLSSDLSVWKHVWGMRYMIEVRNGN